MPTSLSPSSASDWQQCPLAWRYKRIDKLASGGTPATVRGTLVHAVLERLFDLPAGQRTEKAAMGLLLPEWERLLVEDPDAAALTFDSPADEREWKLDVVRSLAVYFTLEDPNRVEPQSREQRVQATLASGLLLNGYIDRVDVAPDGRTRVVDYKSGKLPSERFQGKALDQLKFYALALHVQTGRMPSRLQLIYLRPGASGTLVYDPTAQDLVDTERRLLDLWAEIEAATAARTFAAQPSKLCDWCDFTDACPTRGGTVLPWPEQQPAELNYQEARA